jgi:hypothetical protein
MKALMAVAFPLLSVLSAPAISRSGLGNSIPRESVLRYNKRPNEHPEEFSKLGNFTVKEETTDDASLAVALLRATPGINAKKVFVLGHSLGGRADRLWTGNRASQTHSIRRGLRCV